MSYDYLTPEEMYSRASPKPVQGVGYYEFKDIGDSMTATELQAELNKGRLWIDEAKGVLYTIRYTQYYYTDSGNLKLDNDTGALELVPMITKTIIITGA